MWRRALSSWLNESSPVVNTLTEVTTNTIIPSARGVPVLGTTPAILAAGGATRLHEYISARHRTLGPVFRESLGPVDAVFVSDPTEMRRVFSLEGKYPRHLLPESWTLYNEMYGCKRGLFFMDGEEWLGFRRIMNRLLLRPNTGQRVLMPCNTVASDLVQRWNTSYAGKEVPNLEAELYRWSIDVMIAVMLGEKYETQKEDLNKMVNHFSSVVHLIFEESAKLSLLPAKVAAKLNIAAWKNFVNAINEALNTAHALVSQLIPECQNGEGLLGALLAEELQHEDIVRVLADLILAAGDTTAYSAQWILYLLARDSELQQQICDELQDMQSLNEVTQLPILRGVMREALRLYPVAPFLTRYLPQDSIIGGYSVPAGQLVVLSLYTSGRDADNFPEPDHFSPQRWYRDGESKEYSGVNSAYASLPFAMGARSCIGRKIAETQIMLTTAKILQQFKLELVDPKPVELALRLVAVPSRPVRLWLTNR